MTNDNTTAEITAEELEKLRRKAEAWDREEARRAEERERAVENRKICSAEAWELDAYVDGRAYYDESGEVCIADDADEIPEDAEPADYWDVNEAYGVRYIVDEYGELTAVRYMVACGGPNVYLDTESGDVELYWGADVARYPMSSEAVAWLEEFAVETMPRR